MEYMLILAADAEATSRQTTPGAPTPEELAQFQRWVDFNTRLIADGNFVGGGRLHGVETATTVTIADGRTPTITDGPFAETKELLGGYYLIRAADLDEALEIARRVPLVDGKVEVRPLAARTGEDGSVIPVS